MKSFDLCRLSASLALLASAGMAQALTSTFEGCEGVVEQAGLFPQGSPSNWQDIFGVTWPNPVGNFRQINIANGNMLTLPLLPTTTQFQSGVISVAEAPGLSGGPTTISLSTCRGDLRVPELQNSEQNCIGYGTAQSQIIWFIDAPPSPNYCSLKSGVTYWLNIAYVEVPLSLPIPVPTCTDPIQCSARLGSRTLSRAEVEALRVD